METYFIGIDFGTTNTIISYLHNNNLEAFQYGGPDGQKYIPSFVAYDEDFIEIGFSARETAISQPEIECYANFKMRLPLFELEFRSLFQNGRTPSDVTKDYLNELLLSPDNEFSFAKQQGDIGGIVVSVPEIWQRDINNKGRENLQRIIQTELGFGDKFIQLVSEPVAAAAYYAWENQNRSIFSKKKPFSGNLLVCDMGGGTFDVSLCRIHEDCSIEVLYFDGEGDKGLESAGVAFDKKCVEAAYVKKHGKPINESSPEFNSLMRAFESRKISGHNKFTKKLQKYFQKIVSLLGGEALYNFGEGYNITYEEVEEAFEPVFQGIETVINRVKIYLENNNLDFDRLFLVGGFCQFYLVQKAIFQTLSIEDNDSRYDKSFNITNSAYAISYGACLIANKLMAPSEKFIYSLGIYINRHEAIATMRGIKTEVIEIPITLIQRNTSSAELLDPIFEEKVLVAHHPSFPVKIWIESQPDAERFTVVQDIHLPNFSESATYLVGMKVNLSQIAYLLIKEIESEEQVEYELGNIIAKSII